jgi:DNA-binding NarL/FixJ family response regulator
MTPAKSANILVADDFLDWRVRIRSIMQRRPEWQVICEACDGLQAAEKATELRPDIVLLDIGMPILNGIQAANRIRQGSPTSRIIFLTQDNDEDIRMAALATGAEAYLVKANAASELLPAIDAALRNGHSRD